MLGGALAGCLSCDLHIRVVFPFVSGTVARLFATIGNTVRIAVSAPCIICSYALYIQCVAETHNTYNVEVTRPAIGARVLPYVLQTMHRDVKTWRTERSLLPKGNRAFRERMIRVRQTTSNWTDDHPQTIPYNFPI